MAKVLLTLLLLSATASWAAPSGVYTNHAGLVVSGTPVALTDDRVVLRAPSGGEETSVPLSAFPEKERRRICSDAGSPRIPSEVRRAIEGIRSSVRTSESRAAKGLCTAEESAAHRARAARALDLYLDKLTREGKLSEAEASFFRYPPTVPRTTER